MKKLLLLSFVSCSLISMLPPVKAPAKGKLPLQGYDQKLQNQFVDAVRQGNYTQVQRMLKFRPRISMDGLDDQNQNPLGVAIAKKDYKIAELLLENGSNPNTHAIGGLVIGQSRPAIFSAVENADVEMVELLLRHGAKVEYKYKSGPGTKVMKLIDAVPQNHPNSEIIKALLKGKTKIL